MGSKGGLGDFSIITPRRPKLPRGGGAATVPVPVPPATRHCVVGASWGGDTGWLLHTLSLPQVCPPQPMPLPVSSVVMTRWLFNLTPWTIQE